MIKHLFNSPWVVLVLCFFAVLYLFNSLAPLWQNAVTSNTVDKEAGFLEANEHSLQQPAFKQVDRHNLSWRKENTRDPFVYIGTTLNKRLSSSSTAVQNPALKKPVALQLSSIVIGDQTRLAVINDQVLSIGDHIAGYQLQAIGVNVAILNRLEGKQRRLLSMD